MRRVVLLDCPRDDAGEIATKAEKLSLRRRRSNRPGNSQAKGPYRQDDLERDGAIEADRDIHRRGQSVAGSHPWRIKLSGTVTDGAPPTAFWPAVSRL